MKYFLFTTVFVLLFFSGCKKKITQIEIDTHNVIHVAIETKPKGILQLYTIADSVQFIKLDNSDDALIGTVSYAHFFDDLMFIHDRKGHSVLVYDKMGKFKYKIFRRGNGPGEYRYASHLMVDDNRRQLILYDAGQRKMIFYNFRGEYIKEINNFNNGQIFRDVINLPNGHFLCYRYDFEADSYHGLWETDSLGNYVKHFLNPEIEYPYTGGEDPLFLYKLSDNKVGLMSVENDIYHYENDTLKKFITYKLDGVNILNFPKQNKSLEKFSNILATYEKNNYVLTEWLDSKNRHFVSLFSSIDKTVTSFGAIDYEFGINGIMGHSVHSNLTNILLLTIPAGTLSLLLNDNNVSEDIKSQITTLTSNMSDEEIGDMNPVLEIVYLKQNDLSSTPSSP